MLPGEVSLLEWPREASASFTGRSRFHRPSKLHAPRKPETLKWPWCWSATNAGNGRVGRLLITLFLIERGILPTPLLYLSAFFEVARRDYYEGLRGVSERGEWTEWIEYFLLGVGRMSEDALSRATRMNGKLAEWQKKVAGDSTSAPLRVVEQLAANPFITARGVVEKLEVAFTTAQRAIERLERIGIVKQVGSGKRDRVYCANALLEILEEPARLTPIKD